MQRKFRLGSFAAAALSASLLLSACGDQAALEPAAPSASSAAQVTPRASASSAAQVTPRASAVAQPSQANGDQVVPLPSTSASASAITQQSGGAFRPNEQGALSEYETIVNGVYKNTISAVVNLTDGRSTGSGFIIDTQGHIVTNNHVAGEMQDITITFADNSRTQGQLVGTFANGDIAVVRAQELPAGVEPVALGDSSQVQIGQITVAIGSPLGLQQTVTSGIVSALNRSQEDLGERDPESSLQGLIQTDASINPGNSGGPLFNSRGEVIGMNTLIATLNQGNVGLGFAVPVNRIKRVAGQIIATGEYRRPILGVRIAPDVPQVAEELNLPAGVQLQSVTEGGPAAAAGLQGATEGVQVEYLNQTIDYPTNGDIITAIDNIPVRTIGDLRNILETEHEAGDTITITFVRNGQEQQTQLTLGS
jgi:S1-C subfamily serine protease